MGTNVWVLVAVAVAAVGVAVVRAEQAAPPDMPYSAPLGAPLDRPFDDHVGPHYRNTKPGVAENARMLTSGDAGVRGPMGPLGHVTSRLAREREKHARILEDKAPAAKDDAEAEAVPAASSSVGGARVGDVEPEAAAEERAEAEAEEAAVRAAERGERDGGAKATPAPEAEAAPEAEKEGSQGDTPGTAGDDNTSAGHLAWPPKFPLGTEVREEHIAPTNPIETFSARIRARHAQWPMLSAGSNGMVVRAVNMLLWAWGYLPELPHDDETYSDLTAGGIRKLQTNLRMPPTGVVDGAVWNGLIKNVGLKDDNPAVLAVTTLLNEAFSYYDVIPAYKYTVRVERAVARFQMEQQVAGQWCPANGACLNVCDGELVGKKVGPLTWKTLIINTVRTLGEAKAIGVRSERAVPAPASAARDAGNVQDNTHATATTPTATDNDAAASTTATGDNSNAGGVDVPVADPLKDVQATEEAIIHPLPQYARN